MNEDDKEKELEKDYLEAIIRHIRIVHDNCIILGEKLIDSGERELGIQLIYNGLKHDVSKLRGIEWEYMRYDKKKRTTKAEKEKLAIAVHQHRSTNPHHPEYWQSIHSMPPVYVAEMVCDWKARATEFATSLIDWIHEDALKRFGFTKEDEVYKNITRYIELLCSKPFEEIK